MFLRWTTGETATMHILVVHAMVILLTLGPPKGSPVYSPVFAMLNGLQEPDMLNVESLFRRERFLRAFGHLVS